jgi:phospholipase C
MLRGDRLSRRDLLRAGAAGGALVATGGLPAWARTFTATASAVRRPDSRPFPHKPEGTPSMPKIEHVVVLMMENHSFDNLLGAVPHLIPQRATVDGLTFKHGKPVNFNPNGSGHKVHAFPAGSPCQLQGEPSQAWNASHQSYDGGRNDGFVKASGDAAMWYWDDREIPFTYSLAKHFPLGQRYFCSVLAQTYPNRRFFFCGTASGLISTDSKSFTTPAANGTIWDRLDAAHVDWAIYYQNEPSWLIVPGVSTVAREPRQRMYSQFLPDAAAGKLPQFTFIDPNYSTTSEENPQDIQVGEEFVAQVVEALIKAPTWKNTALFITYDEHGGYYDHVPPPKAIKPDSIAPILAPGDMPGAYDRYGFRVPLIVVSPWAKANYVSSIVQDHTSITAFIEQKWNLPAMTFRDANAHPMTDYFDFTKAAFAKPPKLKRAPGLNPGLAQCHKVGIVPPSGALPPGFSASGRSDVARYLEQAARRAAIR